MAVIKGDAKKNTIRGGADDDELFGFAENDRLYGNDGDDRLYGGLGADLLSGGNGNDYASYRDASAGVLASLANPSQNTGEAAGDTYQSIERLEGSQFDDVLIGDGLGNTLRGNGGADTLDGGLGYDHASYYYATKAVKVSLTDPSFNTGEAKGDKFISIEGLSGSAYNDTLIGDENGNWLIGQLGADTLDGRGGFDTAAYSNATTAVTASLADSSVNTGEAKGDKYISIERLAGSDFNDTLIGDALENWLEGFDGADTLDGGAGYDYASYYNASSAVTVWLAGDGVNTGEAAGDKFLGIEAVVGSAFDDTLTGDETGNWLVGSLGADKLDGRGGADTAAYFSATAGVTASLANSALNTGEAKGDVYVSIERLAGSSFDDNLVGDGGSNWLYGRGGADRLDGGAGFDYAAYFNATTGVTVSLANSSQNQGEAAGDTFFGIEAIVGSGFADILIGDATGNWLVGGLGADKLDGQGGEDTAAYFSATSGITASLANSSQNTGEAKGDVYVAIERLAGSSFDDRLIGDTKDNVLHGRLGRDRLEGGAGTDTASYQDAASAVVASLLKPTTNTGEAAGDSYLSIEGLTGSAHADTLTGDGANNWIGGNNGNDTLNGGAGNDTLDGHLGDDSLVGGLGDDWMNGGAGQDKLNGGAGNDTAAYWTAAAGVTASLIKPTTNTGDAAGDTYVSIERLSGSQYNDKLTGNGGDNWIGGDNGNDTIDGGTGNDTLDGGMGSDTFVFSTALSASNVDYIYGFNVADDTITLAKSIFGAAGNIGPLLQAAFSVGVDATNADQRIIYDSTNGALKYDVDGVGGASAVQFATLSANLALTHQDFLLV